MVIRQSVLLTILVETTLAGILTMFSAGTLAIEITESTDSPGQYLENWLPKAHRKQNTLVLLDIDDTVLTTPEGQWLGSSTMFYSLLDQVLREHPEWTKNQAAEYIDPLLTAIYSRIPSNLTDPSLPEVLKRLQEQEVKVLGITARGQRVRDVTIWQLKEAGIRFTDSRTLSNIPLPEGRSCQIDNGVIFVSHGNCKGEVVQSLLDEKPGFLGEVQQIVMIDDKKKHLVDVGSFLKKQHYLPVHCTFPETRSSAYSHKQAMGELITFLKQWQKDEAISSLINNDSYTRSLFQQHTSWFDAR